jgi:hypothetical protein
VNGFQVEGHALSARAQSLPTTCAHLLAEGRHGGDHEQARSNH